MTSDNEQVRAPTEWVPPVTNRVARSRDTLLETPGYLGLPGVEGEYIWLPNGDIFHLFRKTELAEYDEEKGELVEAHTVSFPEKAILCGIFNISEVDFNLTACGGWSGPRADAKTFAEVKLSCRGEAPAHQILEDDFDNVVANLQKLIQKGRTVQGSNGNAVWKRNEVTSPLIKFHHTLFAEAQTPEKKGPFYKGNFPLSHKT
jgi:hypothetical protein